MEKVLVVGAVQVGALLESGLGKEYTILEAAQQAQALELLLRHIPKVVILDLGLRAAGDERSGPDHGEALRCLKALIGHRPGTKIVVLTDSEERETGYRALEFGAYDFHQKPVDLAQLKIVIARAIHLSGIEEQRCQLQEALVRSTESLEGIADQCAAMRRLFSAMQALERPEPVPEAIDEGSEEAGPVQGRAAAIASYAEQKVRGEGPLRQEKGVMMSVEDLALPTEQLTLREVRDRVEKGMISAAVGNCGGNMVRASELLGVSRPALYDLMKKHGLCKPGARQ